MDERDEVLIELSELYKKYLAHLETLDNDDYEENPEQMLKFKKLLAFFEDYASKNEGKIKNIEVVPKTEYGSFEVVCRFFDFVGCDVDKFAEVIKGASAIGFDVYDNEYVNIGFTVPDVFRRKNNKE